MPSERTVVTVLRTILGATPEGLLEEDESAEAALRIRDVLSSDNVVGVGVAYKERRGRRHAGLALTFYVEKKLGLRRLGGHEAIPPAVSPALSGSVVVPTDVVELGRVTPDADLPQAVQPGHSIGHVDVTAGTLGAIVKTRELGDLMLLSNSHILANSGRAAIGDPILYPGKGDGGRAPANTVGRLKNFGAFLTGGDFVNLGDFAVARPTPEALSRISVRIEHLGLPRGISRARLDMEVVKVGRTTGLTTGIVKDVHFNVTVFYSGVGEVGFQEQVLCSRYSKSGDSGSLVLDNSTKKVVGLHFASASGGSVFAPIQNVLAELELDLVTSEIPRKRGVRAKTRDRTRKATLSTAERARARHADSLRQMGAHAIGVEPHGDEGAFSVVVYFDKDPPARVPSHVNVSSRGKNIRVPVTVRVADRFQPD